MRRVLAVAAMVAVACSAWTAPATDYRETFGIVMLPTVKTLAGPDTAPARCAPGADTEQGFGHVFTLKSGEGDGVHQFALLDAKMGMTPPPTDFDIVFYGGSPVCDIGDGNALASFHGPGNEAGVIPAGTTHALVVTTNGAGVSYALRIFR